MSKSLSIIGFGEAGATFATAAKWRVVAHAFDIDPARNQMMDQTGVVAAETAQSALADSQLVLSLVTADQALEAAKSYSQFLPSGTIWCDMNSVAPATKKEAAEFVEQSGAHYVDVAILAPVHPARMKVPVLVSGPAAIDARHALSLCGFTNVSVVGKEVGRASAIKMIRSIMVKGIEALTDEMMAAADAAGVTSEVHTSLDASERFDTWSTRAAYNLERMTTHGKRRAAEMEEAARTLEAFGVEPIMARGTARRLREATQSC